MFHSYLVVSGCAHHNRKTKSETIKFHKPSFMGCQMINLFLGGSGTNAEVGWVGARAEGEGGRVQWGMEVRGGKGGGRRGGGGGG